MRRRPGITLIEVLVAIFVMAIGLLALLTLFPLGALRMSQALQYDRAASCANAGADICDAFGVRTDPQYDPAGSASLFATGPLYVDPNGSLSGATLGGPSTYATTPTPATPGLNRVTTPTVFPPLPAPQTVASRYFTLLDDMTFYTNGQADSGTPPGSALLQRGDRYTWAYLLHRTPPGSPSGAVDLQVVVYAGRATALPGGETTYQASGSWQDTSVTLNYPAGAPPTIRRGTWILDTSLDPTSNTVHGDFYRVVSVTPTPTPNQINLELQTPISRPNGASGFAITAVTVLDNVVEVFERGTAPSSQWEFHTQP